MKPDGRHDSVFRALLRLFPSEFRGDFGRQMADDFHDQRTDAVEALGTVGVVRLWVRTAGDFVRQAPREHVDLFRRDAAHAFRLLRKRPASTAFVVASLAIGIGLNTAIFSVVSGVIWQSLPFAGSERLVRIVEVDPKQPERTSFLTNANFASVRAQSQTFSAMAAGGYTTRTIVSPGEPERLPGMVVTEGFFETLGVQPILGRTFTAEDFASTQASVNPAAPLNSTAQDAVLIISRDLWQRRFLGRSDIIGQRLRLGEMKNRSSVTIIGVVGDEMASINTGFGEPPQWWYPQGAQPNLRRAQILDTVARLKPGASQRAAQAELYRIAASLETAFPESNRGKAFRALPLLDTVVKNARGQLLFLFGAVLCVLAVTCVNLVHLFLANAAGRRQEFATRVALGATRGHLVRQMLTQSALVAAMGCAGGILFAVWAAPIVIAMAPEGIPRLHEVHLDQSALAFAVGASMVVALVCGLTASVPVLMMTPLRALGSTRSVSSLQGRRVRRVLVVCEIAMAVMLVVASMLMVRTMRSLATLDLGFDPQGVIATTMPRPTVLPDTGQELTRMHDMEAAVLQEVRQLPGVVAAGVGGSPMGMRMGLQGAKLPNDPREFPIVGLTPVSVGYFEALGARLKAGRFFSEADRAGAPIVAMLSESTGRKFWPSGSAVGQTIILPATGPIRVVGVVADMSEFGLVTKGGGIFLTHLQSSYVSTGSMLVRTTGDPQTLVPAIKAIVRRINPEQPFPAVVPLQQQIDLATAPRRFILQLIGIFSLLGLLLAVIGVYGVIAESVAERVQEIGVRMALGAKASDVLTLFLKQGARMVSLGLVVGLAGAYLLRHEMTTMVFGVGTVDPISYMAACFALAITGLAACAIPARRAAKLDPVIALRAE